MMKIARHNEIVANIGAERKKTDGTNMAIYN